MAPLLEVSELRTQFDTADGLVDAVRGVSFDIAPGEKVGVVGESGSGKSVTMLSILGLIPPRQGRVVGGSILFDGADLRVATPAAMRKIRGNDIAMVFQDPMTSLNPVVTVGRQITEVLRLHLGLSRSDAVLRAIELLESVGIAAAPQRLRDYPHQLSGGMRQRVMIAMALACEPRLLIADEPTTALDVSIQSQIVRLVRQLCLDLGTAIIWITHDLALLAGIADRIIVMYAGRVVESAPASEIYYNPRHPYTMGLLDSLPRADIDAEDRLTPIGGDPPDPFDYSGGCAFAPRCRHKTDRCSEADPALESLGVGSTHQAACWVLPDEQRIRPMRRDEGLASVMAVADQIVPGRNEGDALVRVDALRVYFPVRQGAIFRKHVGDVKAVDGVTFDIRRGETLALVGESGCGKSTTGRAILQLTRPTAGRIYLDGLDLTQMDRHGLRSQRRKMQMIFQDPYSSLNPRMFIGDIVEEPLRTHRMGASRRERSIRVAELLALVGLNPRLADRYPHEFSGGMRQRVGIARALALNPSFIVCDEPVSALDVSIQAQVINLLEDLKQELGLTLLFIAHDLSVVRHISDRVAVMYLGKIVELARRTDLFEQPLHPYTQALLSAVPIPDPELELERASVGLGGEVADPANPPSGCSFRTRCPYATDECAVVEPEFREVAPDHYVASCVCFSAGVRPAQGYRPPRGGDPADGRPRPAGLEKGGQVPWRDGSGRGPL